MGCQGNEDWRYTGSTVFTFPKNPVPGTGEQTLFMKHYRLNKFGVGTAWRLYRWWWTWIMLPCHAFRLLPSCTPHHCQVPLRTGFAKDGTSLTGTPPFLLSPSIYFLPRFITCTFFFKNLDGVVEHTLAYITFHMTSKPP